MSLKPALLDSLAKFVILGTGNVATEFICQKMRKFQSSKCTQTRVSAVLLLLQFASYYRNIFPHGDICKLVAF